MSADLSRKELEAMGAQLQAAVSTGEYRGGGHACAAPPLPLRFDGGRVGLVVDVEIAGADLKRDEVIEVAMLLFAATPDG